MTAQNPTASPQGPSWFQILPPAFTHMLTGADNAIEQITEVPTLTIPYAGVWQISYGAHKNFALPGAGTILLHTLLHKNGVAIPGTEAVTGYKTPSGAGFQATDGQTVLHTFAAQDRVTLHAYRSGGFTTAQVSITNGDGGSTGIAAHYVSPGF
ncbi:hypothetical protein DMH18_26800 [Streptomyces sp. WAC 06783]|uniref:hypothetical protein n=1 Tax=Streptomyces sp. WAC 06783 TaxID=2203211 RepID=UPI000F735BC6|nr:hypothetical protein [Streptomyces sp. WAC 06783]RSO07042.1 hypothetical protein DMH18_26800 [Streptomyces sp. WAC 06783]